jgi:four helix bundle protein
MATVKTFKDLLVWQQAMEIAGEVYSVCDRLPVRETYGLASQAKRAAISVPSNIAEGFRRRSNKEFARFCNIAAGSAAELETQLLLMGKLYPVINSEPLLGSLDDLQKMLTGLTRKLRSTY